MKLIQKLIFWLIVLGIAFNVVRLYLSQNDYELIAQEIYPWYFKLSLFGNVLISIASLLSFGSYRKYFPSYVSTCYILIMVFVLIASFSDLDIYVRQMSFFYSIKGLGTFINFGILFYAADTKYFPKLLNIFYYLCFGFIAATFYGLAKVGFGSSRKEYLDSVRSFAIFLIWVFPFFFLQDEENKKKNIVNMLAFLAIFIIILATGSRSYLIIYMVYILAKFREQLKSKNAIVAILGAVVLGGVGFFLIMNSSLSSNIDNLVNNLSERSGEDTRSDQILDFLSQYDPDYLFQGVGPVKKWYWNSISSYYDFLDNQILLIAWWAGLPTICTYVFFLVRSLYYKSEIVLFENIKGTKLMIGLWIAACLGFAIYVTVCSDLYYYFMSLLIGLSTCQYTKILDPEDQLTEETDE